MEINRKKKIKNKTKKKFISMDEKPKTKKMSTKTNLSFSKGYNPMQLVLESFGQTPCDIYEFENLINDKNTNTPQEDDYYQIISKKREEIKEIDKQINEQLSKAPEFLKIMKEIKENIDLDEKQCILKNNEKQNALNMLDILQKELNELEKEQKIYKKENDEQRKKYENSVQIKSNEIVTCLNDIEKEKIILSNMKNKNEENKNIIPNILNNIQKKELEINEEKQEKEKKNEIKNSLKQEYEKVNKIAINDNIFCHNNFFSLLTFFPYFKNVAFISNNNIINNGNENQILIEEKKDINNIDENKIIIDEEMENNEFIKNIKNLLNQKDNSNKNVNFKILKDRRTLQINLKEKYKFKKIFSVIDNDYIAEPWTVHKYTSLKLSTINSYFNEFNMTAISNNYFIIYFVPNLDKTSLNNELHKLYQKLKNNEYIDKNIVIKISVITESNYITLQNTNQESKVKNQLISIAKAGIHTIYGFLYEFTKTNRLNKKNSFRIYIFDYFYPQAVDMMNNITKYYIKKKRKKTGVYKKVIRGQIKPKKRPADKSTSNNHTNNNNLNKGKSKPNNINNKKNNNINKGQIKKNVNNNINTGNIRKNNSFINISQVNNKANKSNINNNKKQNVNTTIDKKITQKSISENQCIIKENSKNKNINININNIKVVKFDEKPKSITPKKNNSANKNTVVNKQKACSIVFNDLKTFKPEHTLVIHDINSDFINTNEFKKVVNACGLLNN